MKFLNINDFLKSNTFHQLIQNTQQKIREQPLELDFRFQLFALYCLQQDWNKAIKQIEFCSSKSKDYLAAHSLYSTLIVAENQRHAIFFNSSEALDKNVCLQFLSPQELKPLIANQANLNSSNLLADEIRDSYLSELISLSGKNNIANFDWIIDSDTRLGANLEVVGKNGYRIIGLQNIQRLEFLKPKKIMDLVWLPIRIFTNNTEIKDDLNSDSSYVYMPTRYPFIPIEKCENLSPEQTQCLISIMTSWIDIGANGTHGFGLKTWISNTAEFPLFELQNLDISFATST